jgi:Leucine-rich repeat (LRR) protein
VLKGEVVAEGDGLDGLRPPPGDEWWVQPKDRASDAEITARAVAELHQHPLGRLALKGATDVALAPLEGLHRLEALSLRSPRVTDEGLLSLGERPGLIELDLGGAGVREARGLVGLTGLRRLSLARCPLSAPAAREIGRLGALESLTLSHTGLAGDALAPLVGLTQLKILRLAGLRPSSLGFLAGLTALEDLDLSGEGALTDRDLAPLVSLRALRRLSLRGRAGLRGPGLHHLAGLLALEELDLGGTSVEHPHLAALEGLTGLTRLSLAHCPLVEIDALRSGFEAQAEDPRARQVLAEVWQDRYELRFEAHGAPFTVEPAAVEPIDAPIPALSAEDVRAVADGLSGGARLQRLHAACAAVGLAVPAQALTGLGRLGRLQRLRVLDLSDTPTAGADLQGLAWPQLALLSLPNAPLGPVGLTGLGPCPALKVIDLTGVGGLPAGVERITSLVGLRLGGGAMDGADGERLAQLTGLESLGLAELDLEGGALAAIGRLPRLTQLAAYRCGLHDAGLAGLGACRSLKELDLGRCTLSPADRQGIGALRGLRLLSFHHTTLGDEDLPALLKLREVAWLGLGLTRLSPGAVAALRAALPATEIAAPRRPD